MGGLSTTETNATPLTVTGGIKGTRNVLGESGEFFRDGSADGVKTKLLALARPHRLRQLRSDRDAIAETVRRFSWETLAPRLDAALETV